MVKKLVVTAIFCTLAATGSGQLIQHALLRARCLHYKQRLYVYGFEQRQEQLSFRCFSYSKALKPLDSADFSLGSQKAEQYLDISQDTLHDVLNFYFQKADLKNLVTLCRLDSMLRPVASASDLDANHINAITAFCEEHYRDKNSLYTITTAEEDSSGRQFYLSKYSLKAMNKPFEYDFKWQFPFERKNIHRATILFSDASAVLLYVHVNDGLKKGQWLLRIDATNGSLIKAVKLNPKGDSRHFLCGAVSLDRRDKSISIAGSILPAAMIDFKKSRADFKTLPTTYSLFLVCVDSLGEISARTEKALSLPVGKGNAPLHPKVRSFIKTDKNNYDLWADLYEEQQPGTFCYYSSWSLRLRMENEALTITPSVVYPVPKLIPDLLKTPAGRNYSNYGKLYLKSVSDYDKLLYQPAPNPVVAGSWHDAKGLPVLLLRKVTSPGGQSNWMKVYSNEKGAAVIPAFPVAKGQSAGLLLTGKGYILFGSDDAKHQFQLSAGEL